MRGIVIALVCAIAVLSPYVALSTERSRAPGLSTIAAIETTRAARAPFDRWVTDPDGGLRRITGSGSVVISPDGERYALKLVRGDMQRNGIWAEILVGELGSLDAAVPRVVGRFFTQAYGSTEGKDSTRLVLDGFNALRWSPNSGLLLHLWEDEHGVMQVVSSDPLSGKTKYLTHSTRDIVEYVLSPDNGLLLYAAKATLSPPARHAEFLKGGFVVTNPDIYSLIAGKVDRGDLVAEDRNSERFVRNLAKQSKPIRVNRPGDDVDSWTPLFRARVSPDGQFAIVDGTPEQVPATWNRYGGTHAADYVKNVAADAKRNSNSGFLARQAKQPYLVDLKRATSRPLWLAPVTVYTGAFWAPDSRSVILAPTFLPAEVAGDAGLKGTAIAEISIATGHFTQLPLPCDGKDCEEISALRWAGTHALEIERAGQVLSFVKDAGGWRANGSRVVAPKVSTPISVDLRQDMNTPPVLYAIDRRTGEEREVLDLNPGLSDGNALGRAELVTWHDSDGLEWSGLLYYPVNYHHGKRYPLVIQTHGHAPATEFSLYGGTNSGLGLGPGTSVYAGRLLAAQDLAVLTIQDHHEVDDANINGEAARYMRAYESAVQYLDDKGLIDLSKVGLSGFSRTGWHVEYALTQSEFSFAAATTSDNVNGSYFMATAQPGSFATENGSPPFAEGLANWLQQSPGFNVQRIRTPLRLMSESAGLATAAISKWEMFSRLRQLNRPVEFYVIPEINRGSHGVQNPAQVFKTQQSTVDWFDFWLNERERAVPLPNSSESAESLNEQYARWRTLREQRDAMLKEPRPPRLRWTAERVEE